ncbi:unnamed protein product [Zymoseptoria tritici ST99CH_1A5]|nr:unnamed protein product [Zymoseptoria tritici ST99CH_1E4]SMR63125.1 unnamed protein product [Zymoseptoria tritici ST99CH_3D1]SMY28498.1 unnamed protein product [Zymoseptoria tritici ST99CH_1A5]
MDKIKAALSGKSKRSSMAAPSNTTTPATTSSTTTMPAATTPAVADVPATKAPVAATAPATTTPATTAPATTTTAATKKAEKPIKLYSHAGGPNPWKVAIIMNELSIPYETILKDFADLKKEPFEAINPNGRVPAIEDPNTGATVWESGAIIEYLLETYDGAHTLSYTDTTDRIESRCWFHLQLSGQGPYFGQKAWFTLYHPEKLESCQERYGNEIKRVIGVIDLHLKKTGNEYLVGSKCTYADLAFVPWHWLILFPPHLMGEDFAAEWEKEFPAAWAWNERLQARPSVAKAREERKTAMGQ